MFSFIERQFVAVMDLLFDEDDSHLKKHQQWLRIAANFMLLIVIIAILIRLTQYGRDYFFNDILGGDLVVLNSLKPFFRSTFFILFLIAAFLIIIRGLLFLRQFIKPFEVVMIMATLKLSIVTFQLFIEEPELDELGGHVLKLFVD
jgi:hypothetical protein